MLPNFGFAHPIVSEYNFENQSQIYVLHSYLLYEEDNEKILHVFYCPISEKLKLTPTLHTHHYFLLYNSAYGKIPKEHFEHWIATGDFRKDPNIIPDYDNNILHNLWDKALKD